MVTNARPVYKRTPLKLSGEALQGTEDFGIGANILDRMAQEIKELVELDIQVGAMIGGGNLFRDAGLARAGMNRIVGNHIGMLTTVVNGLATRDTLHRAYVNARLMSAILLNGVYDSYNWAGAISLLCNNRVVILFVGAGSPFFTTDSAAYLCGIEIETDVMLKVTRVDGVFTTGPTKDPTTAVYEQLTYSEVLGKELKVMDLAALTLAHDHKLPIRVFNMNKSGTLYHVVVDEEEGTLIME